MRVPTVAPISFCKASKRSNDLCVAINALYRRGFSTKEIANQLKITPRAVRYYYYGYHNCAEAHYHWKNAFQANKNVGYTQHSLNQVRIGTSVPLYI